MIITLMKSFQLLAALFLCSFLNVQHSPAQSFAEAQISQHTAATQNKQPELTVYFDKKNGTPFLSPPFVSAVLDDATDPAKTEGITIAVVLNGLDISPADYKIIAETNNERVIPADSLIISKINGKATVRIHPVMAGYADITVTLTAAGQSKSVIINYAASVNDASSHHTFWHSGVCDASDGVDMDRDYFMTGDDEQNALYVYPRYQSGRPLATFYYGGYLGLTDCEGNLCNEVDMEAVTKSPAMPNRTYWLGSMSNGKAPKAKDRPNRNRLFATDYEGTGAQTTIRFAGYYGDLKSKLIKWGDDAGYNFTKASAPGQDCKSPDGFSAEGMVFGPDNTTLYIGMRAPMVPVSMRNMAVIAPLLNFETWFGKGSPATPPTFGKPVEIDLGGRGIREIIRLSNGTYVIAAGNSGHGDNSALYKWTGHPADAPVFLPQFNTKGLNIEGLLEIKKNGQCSLSSIQVICDDGKAVYYDDATQAKDLAIPEFKKFKSVVLTADSNVF